MDNQKSSLISDFWGSLVQTREKPKIKSWGSRSKLERRASWKPWIKFKSMLKTHGN